MSERPPRRARADPEVRRAQILDEAIRIIGERGYHGFTVQELARRCGLTNGALLYYFSSKDQLLAAVLEEHDLRVMDVAGPADDAAREAQRSGSSRAAVLKLLRAVGARAAAEPALTRLRAVLQQEALDPDHPAHAYFEQRERALLDAFARLVAPHVADPPAAARELLAMMEGLEQRWLRARRSFDLAAAWEQTVAKLLPPVARDAADQAAPDARRRHA